ncbi:hypothetical protein SAMN04489812_0300 [Microlunatus soli]|uniref:Uncharacterized protein n=1 Tax=Microlunatus soli TaxID=630515 RepID=A0A1H1MXT2_9ACTN|nr:hypothetical protein SAMN04489812_0300 [Microlunatus soli]
MHGDTADVKIGDPIRAPGGKAVCLIGKVAGCQDWLP